VFRLAALFGLLGLTAATFIIARSGYSDVLHALAFAGWGIVLTSLYHLISLGTSVIGWRLLMPGRKRPSLLFLFYIMWLRASVNNILPVARIGGEVVAVRVMMKHGLRKTTAVASTVVQLTLSVIAVFLFDTVGIGLFAYRSDDAGMIGKLIGGLLLSLPPIVALIGMQKFGFFGALNKIFQLIFREHWKKFTGSAAQLDRAVHAVYRRKEQIITCLLWLLMTWFLGIGEIALALYFLGHPLSLTACFMLEALIQAAISLAFAVPGALGVQEAGFLFFGQILGLPADIAVALSVMRRCRDVLLFVPGLIAWQIQEGKWLLRRKAA
jgi:putative membrane protein